MRVTAVLACWCMPHACAAPAKTLLLRHCLRQRTPFLMPSSCLISVLVTAHNCEAYIADTLNSLKLACRGVEHAVEVILVNDASSDNTAAHLQAFAAHFPQSKIFEVALRNIGAVRNFGVSQCRGEYVTMLDGDDRLLADSFKDIVELLTRTQPDIFLAPLNEVYEHKTQPQTWRGLETSTLTQQQIIEKFLIHRDVQAHFIGQFIKRSLFAERRFPEFTCYEDAWLFPSILTASHHIIFSTRGPYLYFKRGKSLSSQLDASKISLLVQATQQMDEVLGEQYRNLLSCHWINLAHKFYSAIEDRQEKALVNAALKRVSLVAFLLDGKVRFSLKKKFIKMKLNKK